jgi:hypothetical protein
MVGKNHRLVWLGLPNNQFFTTLQNDGSLENITQYIEGVFISSHTHNFFVINFTRFA